MDILILLLVILAIFGIPVAIRRMKNKLSKQGKRKDGAP